jgi:hypothetical protein
MSLSTPYPRSGSSAGRRRKSVLQPLTGYKHARVMLDLFKLKGPYGQRLCIVCDTLGGPICETTEKLPGYLFSSDDLCKLVLSLTLGLGLRAH